MIASVGSPDYAAGSPRVLGELKHLVFVLVESGHRLLGQVAALGNLPGPTRGVGAGVIPDSRTVDLGP